jgi:hypothetical protein
MRINGTVRPSTNKIIIFLALLKMIFLCSTVVQKGTELVEKISNTAVCKYGHWNFW